MKITIDQRIDYSIAVDIEGFNIQLWQKYTEEIYKADRLIYFVDIDGQILHDGYENYILNNYKDIEHIQITTLSRLESIHETENSLNNYLNRFIPGMGSIADQMYGEMLPEVWDQLKTGLEGLQWIVSSFEFLRYLYSTDSIVVSKLLDYSNELGRIIGEIANSINRDDIVGVADLIQYELLPILEKYLSELQIMRG
ncbi:hypothetical protein D3C76_799840 [compost metagenome]